MCVTFSAFWPRYAIVYRNAPLCISHKTSPFGNILYSILPSNFVSQSHGFNPRSFALPVLSEFHQSIYSFNQCFYAYIVFQMAYCCKCSVALLNGAMSCYAVFLTILTYCFYLIKHFYMSCKKNLALNYEAYKAHLLTHKAPPIICCRPRQFQILPLFRK